MSRPRRADARRGTSALVALGAGGLIVIAVIAVVVARQPPDLTSDPGPHPAGGSAGQSPPATAGSFLLVLDFLAYAGEAVASDPIAGHPDAADLIPLIGDPTAFGTKVTDLAGSDPDATSRCGVVPGTTVDALAASLAGRLPPDQQLGSAAAPRRALLHWAAAEGFLSVRLFARDGNSPSCADAGKAF